MAAISPGEADNGWRKPQKPTATTKHYRYEPFTKRIARLKIDPVHKIENVPDTDDSASALRSHFRSSLEEWSELNLSRNFTSFFNQVNSPSETLPQILHHKDKIFESLLSHITQGDELSLEPLLALLAHLAHDLGHTFEQYFSGTITTVAQVATTHQNAEVIEWCFTCQSWMFKYLSRLLIQDLRPLLEIMHPYLSARKHYVARFSAESLAFLLRKAAVLYPKKKAPLTLAITALLEQAEHDAGTHNGIMTLLLETVLGVEGGLHSSAPYLVACLLEIVSQSGCREASRAVVDGFLVASIHRTDRSSFSQLMPTITGYGRSAVLAPSLERQRFAVALLQVVTGTRKGSRISNWHDVLDLYLALAVSQCRDQPNSTTFSELLPTGALLIAYAPLDQLLPSLSSIMTTLGNAAPPRQFFSFCTLVARLQKSRFDDLLLSHLQHFITTRWSEDEETVIYFLERPQVDSPHSASLSRLTDVQSSAEWESSIINRLSQTANGKVDLSDRLLAGFSFLSRAIRFPSSEQNKKYLGDSFEQLVVDALQNREDNPSLPVRIALGWIFQSLLQTSEPKDVLADRLMSTALQVPSSYFRLTPFVASCSKLLSFENHVIPLDLKALAGVQNVLVENLLTGSTELRAASLLLLKRIGASEAGPWLIETVELAEEILNTPYSMSSVGQIQMLLRRLLQRQMHCTQGTTVQKIVPFFCLGLLPHYHEKTRKDLCAIISQLMNTSNLEESILDVLLSWLRSPSVQVSKISKPEPKKERLTPFECSNLKAARNLSSSTIHEYEKSVDELQAMIERSHVLEISRTPMAGRELCLQVFVEASSIAEKRSRLLVPIFLSIRHNRIAVENDASDASVSSHTLSPDISQQDWSRQDRIAFLTLLTRFQNPRVVFRSAELYDRLLELLSNGDTEVRKLALSAILTWKDPILIRHEKLLMSIVDNKTVNAEIGNVLNVESTENPLQQSERSVVLPVLLRLLFGLITGRSGTPGSQEARRKTILRMLFRMQGSEISMFIRIALGPLAEIRLTPEESADWALSRDLIPVDQQNGFVRMMLSLLETLQSQISLHGKDMIDAILYSTLRSCRQIETDSVSMSSLCRNIRRTGLQCLSILFEHDTSIMWDQYIPVIFREAISPRIESFPAETSQGISVLLRIFSVWCRSEHLVQYLSQPDSRILPAVWKSLTIVSGKGDVKTFILSDIAEPLIDLMIGHTNKAVGIPTVIDIEADSLLECLAELLQTTPQKDLLMSANSVLGKLAPLARSASTKSKIVDLLVSILNTSKQRLTPLTKASILMAIHELLTSEHQVLDPDVQTKLYGFVSQSFDYFKDNANRSVLCRLLRKLSTNDVSLSTAAGLCEDLNAMSTAHLDELDYDRRLKAYHSISEIEVSGQNDQMWTPILYNLLFFGRNEDFSIRSNAVSSLRHYIKRASTNNTDASDSLVGKVLLPTLRKRTTDDSETIRADMVSLFGTIISQYPDTPQLRDMHNLLVGDDEEASFFTNILHIQQHRRLRAIRRLDAEVVTGSISSDNVMHFFIPLLQKFIYDKSEDATAQGSKGQSLLSMKILLQWISWKQFRALFRQFKSQIDGEEQNERNTIKLLGHAADALSHAWSEKHKMPDDQTSEPISHLAASLPLESTVLDELRAHFIPKLGEFIHYKDEAQMSARLPAAVTAVKLNRLFASAETQFLSAPIVLDVAQILRSRTQEIRDSARVCLVEIATLLGPGSIQFVLKELRNVLTRGYQLHVLSFTLHAILIKITENAKLGDLDYCVRDLVAVVMDDIFGLVGQEKENQDYVSEMKEVKSSKSLDSIELLARTTSISHLIIFLEPVQTLLTGTLNAKQIRKVDELLRRIGIGLSRNQQASSRELLIFAYQAIKNFYREKAVIQTQIQTNDEKNRQRYLVQLTSAQKRVASGSASMLYKIARFAIDLVRSALSKHDELLTAENVHGFLPIIGDVLIEAQEDVKVSALRLLSTIIKLRMPELDENAPIYVAEAVKVVKNCINTNEEAPQAALKLIAAVLRERKSAQVRDTDIADILHRISPDLEEPDRQGVTFNFIRAVMSRKFQLPQLYELVDKIGIMMVTNHTHGARDVARGVYVHFLLEYPQSTTRWTKQQKFLMKNLEYTYPEGRQSVMEAINMIVAKVSGDVSQELVSIFFVPIVLRMANDDNEPCRELAGALLSQLFKKADHSHIKNLLEPLRSWIEQSDNPELTKLAMQAYTVYFDSKITQSESEINVALVAVGRTLQDTSEASEDEWQCRFQALRLFSKLVELHPSSVMTQKQTSVWASVRDSLTHNQAWIQSSAASLIAAYFSSCTAASLSPMHLTNTFGLKWDNNVLLTLLKSYVRILRRNQGNEYLSLQIIPNLIFLGRHVDKNGLKMKVKSSRIIDHDAINNGTGGDGDADSASDGGEQDEFEMTEIPALQYLTDQIGMILRRESPRLTSAALLPRLSALDLLTALLPHLSTTSLSASTLQTIILPLHHLTDINTIPPRSADPTFTTTYQTLVEKAHEVMSTIQRKVGDSKYVLLMTAVAKTVRVRREERRTKRRIELVAAPEKAAQDKRRKADRKKDRKKEIVTSYQQKRRER